MMIKLPVKKLLVGCILLLYPKRCMLCDEIQPYGSVDSVCGLCMEEIPTYFAPSYELFPTVYSSISRVYPAFVYEGYIRNAVSRLKFNGVKENAAAMAELMKNAAWPGSFAEDIREADFFVPVPLHKSRRRERGFNQAELLSAGLSHEFGIVTVNALIRVKKTNPMYGLSRTERFESVDGAFAVEDAETVKGKNIFLIDDIYTTGATVEECARVLKGSGAAKVYVLTFAYAASGIGKE